MRLQRNYLRGLTATLGVVVLVATLLSPTGALAQSVSCTTFFADTSMPMTSCDTPSGTVNCTTFFADTSMPMTNCDGSGLRSQPSPVYVVPAAVPTPAPTPTPLPDPGLHYRDTTGPAYLPYGSFVKADGAQAIYMVGFERLHGFTSWGQFLRLGGKADLSNVMVFASISSSLVSDPVAG